MKTVILFGAGKWGNLCKESLNMFFEGNSIYFFDNDTTKQNTNIGSIRCLTVDELAEMAQTGASVILCHAAANIRQQLCIQSLEAGYPIESVYVFIEGRLPVLFTEYLKEFDRKNAQYVEEYPTHQVGVDIFQNEWVAKFPEGVGAQTDGFAEVFDDPRLNWGLSVLGSIQGKDILELGYLEGFHSTIMERAGANSILGIDANTRSYLKTLVTKEIMKLQKCTFLCGDFNKFLEKHDHHFDLVCAAGVLYHMQNPIKLIYDIAKNTDAVYMWTHFYSGDVASNDFHNRFYKIEEMEYMGFKANVHYHDYNNELSLHNFMGGTRSYSCWMEREDIIRCFQFFGFQKVVTGAENLTNPNGPCFCIVAEK